MKAKTIYMLTVLYGDEDVEEYAFIDEGIRNELALAFAEELEHANFNLNIAAWMICYPPTNKGIKTAIEYAVREAQGWRCGEQVFTSEVSLYE